MRKRGGSISNRRVLLKSAGTLMLGSVGSRVLGLVREQVIAYLFGASAVTDIFKVAQTVPQSIYDLIIQGAVSAAFVPVFRDYAPAERRRALWQLVSVIFSVAAIVLALIVPLLMVLAPQLITLLTGGFRHEEAVQGLTLLRLMLPALFFLGLSGVTSAVLYALEDFTFPALSTAVYNLGIIIAAVVLTRLFHLGIMSLAIGVILGAILQLSVQLPGLLRAGMRFRFSLNLSDPAVRAIGRLYLPVFLGLIVTTLQVIIDRRLASELEQGSLAALGFATTVVQLPLGLVVTATSLAVLPTLASSASTVAGPADEERYKLTLGLAIKLVLLLMIPATAGLIILRVPLVSLLFRRGAFDANAVNLTSTALLCYAFQLPFTALDGLLINAFYARKNTVVPVLVGVIGVGLYLVVALSTYHTLGVAGLALADSAKNSGHALILLVWLLAVIGPLRGQGLLLHIVKCLLAALLMGVASYGVLAFLSPFISLAHLAGQALLLGSTGLVAVLVYTLAITLLRVEEATLLWKAVQRRLGRVG